MILKAKLTPAERQKYLSILFGVAQIALVLGLILNRLDWVGMDFLEGMLIGFSLVGNLAYLVFIRSVRRFK